MLSWTERSYPIFLYTGIVFFIVHLLIYGLGLDQSYFGLALAYVGYSRVGLYWWVFGLLWLGLLVEGLNLGKTIYERLFKPTDSVNKNTERDKKSEKKKKSGQSQND
jgi:hypothetical protein